MTWPTSLLDTSYAQTILSRVTSGEYDEQEWAPLTVTGGGHTIEILFTSRPLRIDGVFVNVSASLQQQVADALGALLPTPKVMDLAWLQRAATIPPIILPIASTSAAMVQASSKLDAAIVDVGDPSGALTAQKTWALGNSLLAHPGRAMNYGFACIPTSGTTYQGIATEAMVSVNDPKLGRVIQGQGWAHDPTHIDYSQCAYLMHRACTVDGVPRDLVDVLQDATFASLISHEGPLKIIRQPGVAAACKLPGTTQARVMALTTATSPGPVVAPCPMPPPPTNVEGPAAGSSGVPVAAIIGVAAAAGLGVLAAHYAMRRWGRSGGGRGRRENPAGNAATVVGAVSGALAWEGGWWARRRVRRGQVYQRALSAARALRRPLVIIGAPDAGHTAGYSCGDPRYGDTVVDLAPSACPRSIQADITKPLPFADNSVVVACMCTLEYVHDVDAALREIKRVSGDHAFYCGVEPWTMTALLYPNAKRTLPAKYR